MTSLRQLVPAVLLAATAGLGLSAIASPVTASAVPGEWDIERYDNCLNPDIEDPSEQLAWTRKCCRDSGGVWNEALGKCQAPPAEPAKVTRWPGKIPLGVFTQDLTAAP
ncbi:hypothetical protein [Mycolicibacterium sp. 120270]|uniref:hypothetical protein n=1 Tax=Mycolicibacterium sp. 120270 TaxID=3090600 RepID=UPI00299EC486|nr:hypothetical protein [Mycolicibacterium sp. 120270]MDX1883184.1 hypothetical protein [Mycolicibacterium sp. 120270]